MASIKKRPDGKWRARYRDHAGKEHARHFKRRVDAQAWLDDVTTSQRTGSYVDPKHQKVTVREWSEIWLQGYRQNRQSTVRQAQVHIKHINAAFGDRRLASIRPSEVKAWTASMKAQGLADSTVYAIYRRMVQLYRDAMEDNLIPRTPFSRATAPSVGKQRPYVATTAQIWALHDAMPSGLQPAILLGAFAGLRIAEAVALRTSDVDFMRGTITPVRQYGGGALKTDGSAASISIPVDLAVMLNAMPAKFGGDHIVTTEYGRPISPSQLEHYVRVARVQVEGLDPAFRFHDLRHYFASLLISQGLDVKVVQSCLRHASAKTTLDTYGHMFPNAEESARAAVRSVLTARADSSRTEAATS